jgi:predicted nucleic acid-binding protein
MAGDRVARIVVDSSAAVLLILPGPGDALLADRLRSVRSNGGALLAPSILASEVAAAITKALRLRRMTRTEAEDAFNNWLQLLATDLLDLTDANTILADAFELSVQLHHALHDCLYLVLAQSRSATLLTCDSVFARKADAQGVHTELIESQ